MAEWACVTVNYGETRALRGVSLAVGAGERLAVIGPSGCGKSTLLAALAGTVPIAGLVRIHGVDVSRTPPEGRNLGVVFQSYALFPHLSALDNVAFGLMVRGVGRAERRRIATGLLERVGLAGYGGRLPRELSGGQSQRVAVARALAVRPAVLLLDEPFANLDRPLHEQLRNELASLQREETVAAVLVTHDPADALSADRVAVLSEGVCVQVGPPEEVYRQPTSETAARALGGGTVWPASAFGRRGNAVFVRPEDWRLDPESGPTWAGVVTGCQFAGAGWSATVATANQTVTLPVQTRRTAGEAVALGVVPGRAWQFPTAGKS